MPINQLRIKAGEKPPDIITHDDGRRYRQSWLNVTHDSDRRQGEEVYVISAMGEALDDDDIDDEDD
jgi:hypothetical protein